MKNTTTIGVTKDLAYKLKMEALKSKMRMGEFLEMLLNEHIKKAQ